MISYITQQKVSAAMDEVVTTPQEDVSFLTDQMMEEQPAILEFLYRLDVLPFSLEEGIEFDEDEREYILYIGIVVWKTLSESARPTPQVTWDDLYTVITDFEMQFAKLVKQGPGSATGAAIQFIEEHPEPELLRFITDAMRPRPDEPNFPPIRPEYQSIVTMIFQIALTAMLQPSKYN
ncbi:MAG: hypothetical protein KDI79_10565 [Anaerolineae bacterium]|nr:hypothetical protein [Anaerolineae bacterium]